MRGLAWGGALALLLVGLARAEAADAPLTKELEDSITHAIEDELRETQAPGAAVAILREGRLVYLHAFGVRSREETIPVTPDTLFRLGSTTKMLTALVTLDAAAQGRLKLEAPLRTYVKELDPALGKLTPRQLLTHTAGMREASPATRAPTPTRTSCGSRCRGMASGSC